jgi:hypothetical protein
MRNHFFCAAAAGALVFILATVSAHATPSQIFNTGTTAGDTTAADGSGDLHYIVGPGGPTAPVNSGLSATPAADGLSAWIQPTTNLGPGSYDYETTFTDTVAEPITITGQWAAYASGVDIRMNGVSSGQTIANPGYTAWHPFTLSGTTLIGTNTLDFYPASAGGATGVRVEILSVVPEPASLTLLALAPLGVLVRRRR